MVSLTIAGILIALLAPAVLQAREAARSSACRSNLRQIALGTHLFHDTNNSLPPLEIANSWASWAVFVLPGLDQSAIYHEWNLSARYYRQPNTAGGYLQVFHCPSRPFKERDRSLGSLAVFRDGPFRGPPGWTDYGASAGTLRTLNNGAFSRAIDNATGLPSAQLGASFSRMSTELHPGWRSSTSFQSLSADGLGNTLMLGEIHIPSGQQLDVMFNGSSPAAYSRVAGCNGAVDPSTGRCAVEFRIAQNPKDSGAGWTEKFGSNHMDRCHFALASGAVISINVSIDLGVLDRMVRVGDGGVVEAP